MMKTFNFIEPDKPLISKRDFLKLPIKAKEEHIAVSSQLEKKHLLGLFKMDNTGLVEWDDMKLLKDDKG